MGPPQALRKASPTSSACRWGSRIPYSQFLILRKAGETRRGLSRLLEASTLFDAWLSPVRKAAVILAFFLRGSNVFLDFPLPGRRAFVTKYWARTHPRTLDRVPRPIGRPISKQHSIRSLHSAWPRKDTRPQLCWGVINHHACKHRRLRIRNWCPRDVPDVRHVTGGKNVLRTTSGSKVMTQAERQSQNAELQSGIRSCRYPALLSTLLIKCTDANSMLPERWTLGKSAVTSTRYSAGRVHPPARTR